VSFVDDTVSATVNDEAPVSLPINLSATADRRQFRFCYRGEGTGNINKMLIDDVSVAVNQVIPAVSSWGLLALVLALAVTGTLAVRKLSGQGGLMLD